MIDIVLNQAWFICKLNLLFFNKFIVGLSKMPTTIAKVRVFKFF